MSKTSTQEQVNITTYENFLGVMKLDCITSIKLN